ncbi:MAG TPA: type II secretion system F family protein [Patescibacteria group bacterium]|nr:type II secretion system F family protein [Patescibacteria group bacterium]
MKFYYRAVTQNGKPIQGFIDSRDTREAALYLQKHQLIPIKILEAGNVGLSRYVHFLKKASMKDLIFFTRQLSSMLGSGLTLMQSLLIMRDQMKTSAMADSVQSIVADVENGKTLSAGIEKYPDIFSPIYIALIRTGESSGLLDKVLTRLAENLEKQENLRETVRGALLYPMIVVIMMIAVTVIMMIFVIPQLNVLYQNLNIELPAQTRFIVFLSDTVTLFWPLVIGAFLLGVYGFRRWYKQDSGRRIVDQYLLRIPIFGKLMMESMMAEFARTFGLLISSGSLVVDSLLKSADVVDNIHYRDAIVMVAKRVEKGITVSDAFGASAYFPPYLVQMSKIGEQTGKLDDSLLKASEYYEREVNQTVKTLTTLMEPLIMILLAFGVGFLIFAVITPIYNVFSSIQ